MHAIEALFHQDTDLELSHQRPNLLLQSLIRHLPSPQINLVPYKYNRYVHPLTSEEGEPVFRYPIECRRIGDTVYQADHMGTGEGLEEVCPGRGGGCVEPNVNDARRTRQVSLPGSHASSSCQERGLQEESMIHVVTFSGVTSGGIVTSGTTCCTCTPEPI